MLIAKRCLGIISLPGAVCAFEFLLSEAGSALTLTGLGEPLLSGGAVLGSVTTVAPTWSPVVLQLNAGAVGGPIDIHRHGVHLYLGLLGNTGGAQTIQTQPYNS